MTGTALWFEKHYCTQRLLSHLLFCHQQDVAAILSISGDSTQNFLVLWVSAELQRLHPLLCWVFFIVLWLERHGRPWFHLLPATIQTVVELAFDWFSSTYGMARLSSVSENVSGHA